MDCTVSDLEISIVSIVDADCGSDNGEIEVEVTGGTAPYHFDLGAGELPVTSTFTNLSAQTYGITVIDAHGCTARTAATVNINEIVSFTYEVTDSGCGDINGTIRVFPIGGIPPYIFQLGANGTYTDSPFFEGLHAGSYSVWIKDVNNCGIGLFMDILSGVSFNGEVADIITAKCSTASCHGGTTEPDLRELSSIQSNIGIIKTSIQNNSMPPDDSLTIEQIRRIVCWLEDGAPDN